ncbi:TPA: CRISPR-associated helicase Cas3' [Corynebacterium striatum]|nr:CRISPR-associated helicase Cas3' [Corynebacterium striatum]
MVGESFLGPASLAWAKPGDESGYLSVWQHLVDTRDVASRLWDTFVADSIKQSLATTERLEVSEVRALAVFLAGIHDVGKITRSLQRKIPPGANAEMILGSLEDVGLDLEFGIEEVGAYFPHGLASSVILYDWLLKQGMWGPVAETIASVVESHHGIPARTVDYDRARAILREYPENWLLVQAAVIEAMADATEVKPIIGKIQSELFVPTIQLITGLVIAADWCASNERAFPYVFDCEQEQRVQDGLASIGFAGLWSASKTMKPDVAEYFAAAFGWPDEWDPRPIQQRAFAQARRSEGASLHIIEASTGSGKTEAALAVAHAYAEKHGCHGVVFAAPTMATANGLFNRVIQWAQNVVPAGDTTAAYLAHSMNSLVKEYQRLRVKGVGTDTSGNGSVTAMEWFASPKKGLLSNFAVSTVDQVLMMALQSRHNMLRHLGLAGKVVIIDEVHAYDSFTSAYLESTLKWLAWYEVPVILLSATLPVDKKESLVQAYRSVLGEEDWESVSDGYPLLTIADANGVREESLDIGPNEIHADVSVIGDTDRELLTLCEELLTDGGCALVVCNTVRRAQNSYSMLVKKFPDEVELHHAAFIAHERAVKEGKMLQQLGPEARRGRSRPHRRIYVATQVVEQSLDIDVDVMISDMAPIDLLVQRAGRLHRHQRPLEDRPEKLRRARLFIRGAEGWDEMPVFDSGTAAIYDPAVLLASAAAVSRKWLSEGYRRPEDIAGIVRGTYATVADPESPVADWQPAWDEAREESRKLQNLAINRSETFRYPDPDVGNYRALFARYFESKGSAVDKEEAAIAQVRDADPTIEVIPIETGDFGYRPWGTESEYVLDDESPEFSLARHLAGATVRLPTRMSKHESVFDRVIDQLEKETPVGWVDSFLLKNKVALRLDSTGEANIAGFDVKYSPELGLEVK